jgi:hypothetical protein
VVIVATAVISAVLALPRLGIVEDCSRLMQQHCSLLDLIAIHMLAPAEDDHSSSSSSSSQTMQVNSGMEQRNRP